MEERVEGAVKEGVFRRRVGGTDLRCITFHHGSLHVGSGLHEVPGDSRPEPVPGQTQSWADRTGRSLDASLRDGGARCWVEWCCYCDGRLCAGHMDGCGGRW